MEKNNSTKIIKILIMVFIVIILIIGCLFIFLATDLFKSDKTLFLKYAMQLVGKEDSFFENDIVDYYTKIMETPVENESTLNFSSEQSMQDSQLINQLNITLNGKMDIMNKNIEESLSINYSPEVTLPINLRYKDGLFGYQTDYVGGKYIVDDRTQTNSSNTSQSNENEQNGQMITREDIENFVKKYGEIAVSQLSDDKFSKENSEDATIYKVNITSTDVNNMMKAVCESLKQDQETMEKFELDSDKIDDYLENLENNSQSDETSMDIALYKNNGKITKIETTSDGTTMSLEKIAQNENLQYKAIMSNENTSLELDLSYSGLATLQNVEDNYSLKLNSIDNGTETNVMTYNLRNKINFVDSVDIESFNDDNAVIYSRYDAAQMDSFSQAVNERMNQVNQVQMEELGISESQNPIIQAITLPIYYVFMNLQASDVINNTSLQEQEMNLNTNLNQGTEFYNNTNTLNQNMEFYNDASTLNQSIEPYDGTDMQW